MKKLFYLLVLMVLPFCLRAQNPVQISQPYKFLKYVKVVDSLMEDYIVPQGDSTHLVPNTAWIKRNLGAAVVPPNSIISGLTLTLTNDSTVVVSTGTWRINNVNYSKGTTTTFNLITRDSVYSRYVTFYANTSNQVLSINGVLSPDPIEPTLPANTIRIGSALITPTGTTLNQPSPSSNYVYATPTVKQQAFPIVRALTTDTLTIGGAYRLPSIDGLSGQVPQTDGNGNVFWANVVYTNGFGMLLNSNVFSVDTTKISTIRGVIDSLNAHSAYLSRDFKVRNDTLFLGDTIRVTKMIGVMTDTPHYPIDITGNLSATLNAINITNLDTTDGRATIRFETFKRGHKRWELGAGLAGSVDEFGLRRIGNVFPNFDVMWDADWDNMINRSWKPNVFHNQLTAATADSVWGSKNDTLVKIPFSGGGGVNIYNSNGSLTDDRTVNGNGKELDFNFGYGSGGSFFRLDSLNGVFFSATGLAIGNGSSRLNSDSTGFFMSHLSNSHDGVLIIKDGFSLFRDSTVDGRTGIFADTLFSGIKISDFTKLGLWHDNSIDRSTWIDNSYVDKHWVDSALLAGGGVNIYNSDGTLTGNRQVHVDSHSLGIVSHRLDDGVVALSLDSNSLDMFTSAGVSERADIQVSNSGTAVALSISHNYFGTSAGITMPSFFGVGIGMYDGLGYGLTYGSSDDYASALADPSISPYLVIPKGETDLLYQPKGHTVFIPTTGSTVTTVINQNNIINPAGSLVALTLDLPGSPVDDDRVYFTFTQAVTTITYSSGTVVGAPTSAAIGSQWYLTYDLATSTWY